MNRMIEILHSAPFLRLLAPLLVGIVLGDTFAPPARWFFFTLIPLLLAALWFLRKTTYDYENSYGSVLIPTLIALGIFLQIDHRYEPKPMNSSDYFATFEEYPVEKEKTYRVKLLLFQPKIVVLGYLEKSEAVAKGEPGTVIWFRGKPELIENRGNPYEFDYRTYARHNGFGHRIILRKGDYQLLSTAPQPTLTQLALVIRERLLQLLSHSGSSGEPFHLISSVALGARELLEPETTKSFSNTGVIHVLAVSGMNVGLIYIVLERLLAWLKRRRSGVYLQTMTLLLAIWGYALITGLSASVLRAAAMFSFIVIGRSLNRQGNITNTLAASAFILLLFDPNLLYDVGFQLSYVAVLSIVYLQPYFYQLYTFKNWLADQVWSLITVSIAAQLGTLPLIIHYFHQFPTWFLLANLLVIPLVSVILYLSFAVFLIAPFIPALGRITTAILDLSAKGMLWSVHLVEQLPYALIENLYPSDLTILVIFCCSALLVLYFRKGIRMALPLTLILLIAFLIYWNVNSFRSDHRHEITVFNLPDRLLMACTAGHSTYWIDSKENKPGLFTLPLVRSFEQQMEINKTEYINVVLPNPDRTEKNEIIQFDSVTIAIGTSENLSKAWWRNALSTPDLIIAMPKGHFNQIDLRKRFPKAILIDGGKGENDTPPSPSDDRIYATRHGAIRLILSPDSQTGTKVASCQQATLSLSQAL